ncbi:hypothetical protein [Oceanobacillus damuensis]|uniref:hypothetical protein n=1 Tax=Oceanobacillus damuensis TaxID=937928 RepID=UPI00082E4CA7|nr:hypothetical protein [Oceanobacillus damuensis]
MKMSAQSAAGRCIEQFFPDCHVAFLAGSSVRKELTEHSDLDIVIIDETQSSSYLHCLHFCDWDMELFVFNRASLSFFFDICRIEGLPTIPHMCVEGTIIRDDGSAEEIRNEAENYLQDGPAPINKEKENYLRYTITDLLNDLDSSISNQEKVFTANKLFDLVTEYTLKVNGQWLGHGKWMYRSLRNFDASFSERILETYNILIKNGESKPFITMIDEVLAPHGGRLFEGYKNFI